MSRWLWSTLAVLVLWLGSVFYAHHRGVESERTAQAAKVEKVVKKHKKVRENVEDKVYEMPEAPTVPVRDAPDDSAASRLRDEWSRD